MSQTSICNYLMVAFPTKICICFMNCPFMFIKTSLLSKLLVTLHARKFKMKKKLNQNKIWSKSKKKYLAEKANVIMKLSVEIDNAYLFYLI